MLYQINKIFSLSKYANDMCLTRPRGSLWFETDNRQNVDIPKYSVWQGHPPGGNICSFVLTTFPATHGQKMKCKLKVANWNCFLFWPILLSDTYINLSKNNIPNVGHFKHCDFREVRNCEWFQARFLRRTVPKHFLRRTVPKHSLRRTVPKHFLRRTVPKQFFRRTVPKHVQLAFSPWLRCLIDQGFFRGTF